VPHAVISIEPAVAGLSADDVVVALQEGDPPIYVFERHAREGVVVFMPEALAPGQSQIIAGRLAEILRR
jgi:L-seryl-tRNA(Ser) seleniumtransferase/D-glucosaminate-6-phosphate ammonia-lyase